MAVGESRSELLAWLNSVFSLDYTKVEQCGTGAAYCQIIDSIYGGVPMAKVKFGYPISEYDSRNNMKVFQGALNRHRITRQIDTERLIKCRLQDNLELLQWLKRHWMENKDANVSYDAPGKRRLNSSTLLPGNPGERNNSGGSRRSTISGGLSGTNTPSTKSRVLSKSSSINTSQQLSVPKQRVSSSSSAAYSSPHRVVSESRASTVDVHSLTRELAEKSQELRRAEEYSAECKIMMDSLEAERNFFHNKLREIEILTRNLQDQYAQKNGEEESYKDLSVLDIMGEIQSILYTTEKGFAVQDNTDAESF